MLTNTNLSEDKFVVTPGSGVNLSEFSYNKPKNNETIEFLYLGRIMEDKGFNEFLDAATYYQNDVKIKFIAMGFVEDDYKDKISSINLKNLEIKNYSQNVSEIIEHSTAIIHPSYHEGMSNVLLESAAIGRPLLASNIPGCREIVDDGLNGFLFEPKDSDSLINSISKFLDLDYNQVLKMSIYGRNKIETEFDRNIVYNIVKKEILKKEI